MTIIEQYNLTLQIEVLKEQSAEILELQKQLC